MKRLALALLVVAGCGGSNNGNGNKPDLSQGMQGEPDLSTPDGEDMRKPKPDLAATDDMLTSTDLASAPIDFSGVDLFGVDLSTVVVPPDLGGADLRNVDMVVPPDMVTVGPDMAGMVAFGQPCTAGSTCATPGGDTGFCALTFGHPVCVHTCNAATAYTTCESGNGLCIPDGTGKSCLPKCGGLTNVTCAGGSSCAFLGADSTGSDVGVCVPDCSTTITADACTGAGRVCDPTLRRCVPTTCSPACLTGSSCVGGICVAAAPKTLYADCTPSVTVANGCPSNLCFSSGAATPGFCGSFCNSGDGPDPGAAGICGTGGVCWGENNRSLANDATGGDLTGGPLGQFFSFGGRTAGACMKKCDTTANCPTGLVCSEWNGVRACVLETVPAATLPAAGSGKPGELCRNSSQCASGNCGLFAGYVDGICTKVTAVACPAGTTDVSATVGANACFVNCDATVPLSCNGSQVCDDIFSTPAQCRPALVCRTNSDCAGGYTCNAASGTCLATAPTGTNVIGEACTAATDCASGFCLTAAAGFSGGYCAATCTQLADQSDTCPSGALCIGIGSSGFGPGSVGLCFDLCDTASTGKFAGGCPRTGYKCTPLSNDPRVGFCEPM